MIDVYCSWLQAHINTWPSDSRKKKNLVVVALATTSIKKQVVLQLY
jgi:hypothetical protein